MLDSTAELSHNSSGHTSSDCYSNSVSPGQGACVTNLAGLVLSWLSDILDVARVSRRQVTKQIGVRELTAQEYTSKKERMKKETKELKEERKREERGRRTEAQKK